MSQASTYFDSPVGWLHLEATDQGLTCLSFMNEYPSESPRNKDHPIIRMTITQLNRYFENTLTHFSVPIDLHGNDFEVQIWKELQSIPFGQTTTYGNISKLIDNPKAIRAIGSAIGRNPVVIIVPCHRVIGANDHMVGFGGGIWRKEWLLKHEGALLL